MPTKSRNTIESLRQRFTVENGGCWLWTGKVLRNGYGELCLLGKYQLAHRAFYTHFKGPIGDGLQIDHLCRERRCVNPDHLEAVTPKENTRRSSSIPAQNAAKTECIQGHALSGENLYITPDGRRQCRICRNEVSKEWARRKAS